MFRKYLDIILLKYENLSIFFLSIIFTFLLSQNNNFNSFLLGLGEWGYLGAFIAGILFVSIFTVSTGILILIVLSQALHPIEIGIIAGAGAVIGDLTIFRFIKDRIAGEVLPIYHMLGGHHMDRILHTKYFSWTLPVLGAILIASPFPDEIGVSLLGIANMKTYKFIILSFLLNSIGIFLVVSAAIILK